MDMTHFIMGSFDARKGRIKVSLRLKNQAVTKAKLALRTGNIQVMKMK